MSLSGGKNLWYQVNRQRKQRAAERERETWDCAACEKAHSFRVERVKLQNGKTVCMRRFTSGNYEHARERERGDSDATRRRLPE